MVETLRGFSRLDILCNKSCPADLDTGTLIFVCALRHKESYNNGDYMPDDCKFQRQIITLNLIYKWDYTCVFDGHPPSKKRHENQRRRECEDSAIINSTIIAIQAHICKRCYVKYTVAPIEADMQIGRSREGTVTVCCDSNETTYGNCRVVFVDS